MKFKARSKNKEIHKEVTTIINTIFLALSAVALIYYIIHDSKLNKLKLKRVKIDWI